MSAWFTRNPVAANLLVMLVVIGGFLTMIGMRIEGFPKLPPSYISVDISYPGASAEQVDQGVSRRVEKSIEGLAGIKKVISMSFEDTSQILIQKETSYSMTKLLNDVKMKVEGIAHFPEKAEKPVISVNEFEDFVLVVQIYGDMDDKTLQDSARLLEEELLASPKISKIEIFGKKPTEMRVEVNQEKLSRYGLNLRDLKSIINSNNANYGFGTIKGENGYITLRADSKLRNYDQLMALPIVTDSDGGKVLLSDVATIIDAYRDVVTTARYQGKESVGIVIYTSTKGDMMEISKSAAEVVDNLKRQLPESIKIDIWANYSNYMKNRILLLQSNAWQGLLIVFVILAVFLNFKLAFWVAMGIPFSIAGALAIMGETFLNYSINDITTFGMIIVLGILVDDAVVVGESIYEERQKITDPIEGTIKGVHRVTVATVFGVLTTIAAFFPLILIKNDLGKILSSFSVVVIVALLFSLIESKLVLPAHLAGVSITPPESKNIIAKLYALIQSLASGALNGFNKRIYEPVLKISLRHRYSALTIFVTFAFIGIWLVKMGYIRTVFFPDIPSDVVTVNLKMENGSSDKMTYRNADIIEKAANYANEKLMEEKGTKYPPIKNMMTAVTGGHSIDIYAELQPQDKRTIPTKEMLKLWRKEVKDLEGVESFNFVTSTETGGGFKLNVESRNSDSLETAVKALESALGQIDGVTDIRNDLKSGEPELRISIKPEARHLNITPAQIAAYIDEAYGGYEVDRFHRGTDEVKLKIIYKKNQREYIYQLLDSKIRLDDGTMVPISTIANIESRFSSGFIRRENSKRAIEVKASLDKDIISSTEVMTQLQKTLERIEQEQPDVKITAGGELQEENEMRSGMLKALFMIVLLIYALLAIPLKSYWKPFVIMSVIPFGFIGAVVGHIFAGLPVSVLSIFGMLALAGIVVNDSLVMLTRFNNLLEDGHSVKDALTLAGTSRLRAIFLTTATTVCGLLPLMSETSEQAQYLIPAAVSLAYGEIFATFITLLLIPILMNIAYDIRGLIKRREA